MTEYISHAGLNSLAEKAREGDRKAEESIYINLSGLVFFLSRRHKITGAETEDALQEGFMAIHSAIENYDAAKGNFYTFARQCIENRLLSSVKASNRDKHKYLNGYVSLYRPLSEENDDELVELIPSLNMEPEDELIHKEEMEELQRKIDFSLTALEKEVLTKYLEGKAYAEIADELAVSTKSVDNALRRVKNKLGETK